MLSHSNRFHGHGSLRYLFRKGKTARSRHLMLRYTPNTQRVHSRIAVVVSKKVFKAAVKRNRVRRRIFEIVRHDFEMISTTHDITFTVFSPDVLIMPSDELRSEITHLLMSSGIAEKDTDTPS